MSDRFEPDVIVVGAGLAGLVATHELVKAGQRGARARPGEPQQPRRPGVLVAGRAVLRRQPRAAPDGDQGLPRAGAARTGWARPASTASDDEDRVAAGSGPRRTSSSRPPRSATTCASSGCGSLPFVGWAERGDGRATGHGNSVPRFHLTWGTGPEVVRVFAEPVERGEAARAGTVRASATRSTSSSSRTARVVGVRGTVLEPTTTPSAA